MRLPEQDTSFVLFCRTTLTTTRMHKRQSGTNVFGPSAFVAPKTPTPLAKNPHCPPGPHADYSQKWVAKKLIANSLARRPARRRKSFNSPHLEAAPLTNRQPASFSRGNNRDSIIRAKEEGFTKTRMSEGSEGERQQLRESEQKRGREQRERQRRRKVSLASLSPTLPPPPLPPPPPTWAQSFKVWPGKKSERGGRGGRALSSLPCFGIETETEGKTWAEASRPNYCGRRGKGEEV